MTDRPSAGGEDPADPSPPRESGELGRLLENIGLADPTPASKLPPSRKERLEGDDLEQLIALKRFYGRSILVMMAVQLFVVNAGFFTYSWAGFDWAPPDGVVQVWLTATFVQIVSVVVVITRSLFPGGNSEEET